jgi:hypothetical protein
MTDKRCHVGDPIEPAMPRAKGKGTTTGLAQSVSSTPRDSSGVGASGYRRLLR